MIGKEGDMHGETRKYYIEEHTIYYSGLVSRDCGQSAITFSQICSHNYFLHVLDQFAREKGGLTIFEPVNSLDEFT